MQSYFKHFLQFWVGLKGIEHPKRLCLIGIAVKVRRQQLKINPYFVRDYETASRNYSLGKLASCIGYLNDADLRSKGIRNAGTVTDGELLKELVFKIIH